MCLEYIETDAHERKYVRHAIKQALAAQQEHEPENEPYVSLASVQEPVAKKTGIGLVTSNGWDSLPVGTLFYTTQPAAQKPWVDLTVEQKARIHNECADSISLAIELTLAEVRKTAAQPAVPDAMTSADIQEHIEYVAGWNDCRQAMMEMMK
jgi:hypothetical protein